MTTGGTGTGTGVGVGVEVGVAAGTGVEVGMSEPQSCKSFSTSLTNASQYKLREALGPWFHTPPPHLFLRP